MMLYQEVCCYMLKAKKDDKLYKKQKQWDESFSNVRKVGMLHF